ncbi:DNA-binding NarL/FixJ family response regulator [Streptomyces sp. SAI-170]
MIRVLLVHDVGLVRSVLAEWLGRAPDLRVDETAWRSAPARVRTLRPDVCAADLDCDSTYGVPPLGDLRPHGAGQGTPRLLVLAGANRPGLLRRALEAGATGYVDRAGSPQRLVDGIRRVAAGERFVDDSLGFGFLRPPRCR